MSAMEVQACLQVRGKLASLQQPSLPCPARACCVSLLQVPRLTAMLRAFGGDNHQLDVAALFIQRSQALLQRRRVGMADKAGLVVW